MKKYQVFWMTASLCGINIGYFIWGTIAFLWALNPYFAMGAIAALLVAFSVSVSIVRFVEPFDNRAKK